MENMKDIEIIKHQDNHYITKYNKCLFLLDAEIDDDFVDADEHVDEENEFR